MSIKICSFFGHSEIEITDELKLNLINTIESLINNNYMTFYFGGFGMFDDLCWKIITQLKQKYPLIKRVYCLSDPRHLRRGKRPKWVTDQNYEEIIYLDLEFDWWYKRIYFRNVEIINKSDFVVFYVNHYNNSGAHKALQYAIKKKKHFINLAKKNRTLN